MINYDLNQLPSEWLNALTLTPGASRPLTEYKPVLAVTVTRTRNLVREVLATVRSIEENVTHPVTLSSPTMRRRDGERTMQRLFIEKLGVNLEVTPGLETTWQGKSVIGSRKGRPVTEKLTMTNVHLDLGDTENPFPASTRSYSWIGFVPEDEYLKIVMTRDASPLGLEETPVVYGLCTLSTVHTLKATR